MERGRSREKGKDNVLTTTTSVTMESEIRKSTIVSSTENGAVGDDAKAKAEVSFTAEPIMEEFKDYEGGGDGKRFENGDDAIDELANIVEA